MPPPELYTFTKTHLTSSQQQQYHLYPSARTATISNNNEEEDQVNSPLRFGRNLLSASQKLLFFVFPLF